MSFDSETEINRIHNRIQLIEEVVNSIQVAITNLATNEALSQLLLLRQKDMDSVKQRLTAAEAQIELLKGEVFK